MNSVTYVFASTLLLGAMRKVAVVALGALARRSEVLAQLCLVQV